MKTEKHCKRCDTVKPISEFTKSASRSDGVQPYCSECMKLYRIEYYRRNKNSHYLRNKKMEAKLRAYVIEIKKGKCTDCPNSFPDEPWLMEFDHREPSKKSNDISYFVKNGSIKLLQEELDKCDLVCVICHRRRTARFFGWVDNRLMSMLD